jgi:hypothetical protein
MISSTSGDVGSHQFVTDAIPWFADQTGAKSHAGEREPSAPRVRPPLRFRLCRLMQSGLSTARAFLEEVKTGGLDANR